MPLSAGTRLGPYVIEAAIGAGGMGEVYRATDTNLARQVAIKVLPEAVASDPIRLARFEREAKTLASLNHPNIAQIHGLERADGQTALVMELIEGPTLSDRIAHGPIEADEVLSIAKQISQALDAAHERGIIHRDLKPGNIKVTPTGIVKVLDFGLAKPDTGAEQSLMDGPTLTLSDWVIAGTAAYMSPEQARGARVDKRIDIWAFGCVLYEMLSDRRAFAGQTSADTIAAVLRRDPDWSALPDWTPAGLHRLLRRCLDKDPRRRLRDIGDARIEIEELSLTAQAIPVGDVRADGSALETETARDTKPTSVVAKQFRGPALATAIAVPAIAAAFLIGMRMAEVPLPNFQQLTFQRGTVLSARFADNNTIVYSAAWEGGPPALWSVRPDNPESRSLDIANARVAAVSSSGEMAILIGGGATGAMLARLPLNASTPRQVLGGVNDADWTSDGRELAVAHVSEGKTQLEFPIGMVLYESEGWIDRVRISPDGERVAFVDHPFLNDDRGTVRVVNRMAGQPQTLSGPWASVTGTSWSPRGDEIWFTAAEAGLTTSLYAVDLSGSMRLLSHFANRATILDIDGSGRVLMSEGTYRLRITATEADSANERDLSWLDGSVLSDLSPDGGTLLLDEVGAGAGTPLYAVYLRKTDGSPAIKLGEGAAAALSPNGEWAATLLLRPPPSVVLLPTGAGQPRTLERGPVVAYQAVTWFPDGRRLLIAGSEAGGPVRLWSQQIAGGEPEPIGPEAFRLARFTRPISPDGSRVVVIGPNGDFWLQDLTSSAEPQPINGLDPQDVPIRWDARGRSLYFYRQGELPAVVHRLSLIDSQTERVAVLAPADLAGVNSLGSVQTTPEGRVLVYTYPQVLSNLFLMRNLS